MRLDLGCLTRPWGNRPLEEALAGISAAGYRTVGFTGYQGQPLPSGEMTDRQLEDVRAMLGRYSLTPQASISQPSLHRFDRPEAVRRFLRQMEQAAALGMGYFILTGITDESRYEEWAMAVADCLGRAQELGLYLVLKPHGGLSSLAKDLAKWVDRLSHPSFGICYDPGNIFYYTGENPVDDLPKIVQHVRALCIKDEVGGKEGEVMITPGTGLVDFPRIFSILSEAGFSGPGWVECVGGADLSEINAEAAKAHRFLSEVLAGIGPSP